MTHRRILIRDALASVLDGISGVTVHKSRTRPLQAAELPAIDIRLGGEDIIESLQRSSKPAGRWLRVALDIYAKASGSYEDDAHAVLDGIEAALFANHITLSGNALGISLDSIADPEMDDSADKPAYRLTVNLGVIYTT